MRLISIFLFFSAAAYGAGNLKDGLYVREANTGQLQINKGEVTLNTINRQGNVCDFKGPIANGRATQKAAAESSSCVLGFKEKVVGVFSVVEVEVLDDSQKGCNEFCGLNGDLSGDFYLQKPECNANAISQTRAQYKSAFDKKNFREAVLSLESKINSCKPFFSREDLAWSKNDLALGYFHLDDKPKCLSFVTEAEALVQGADNEKLEKAVQHNKQKCQAKGQPKATKKKK